MKQIPLGLVLILCGTLAFAGAEQSAPARVGTDPTIQRQTPPTDFGSRVQQGAPQSSLPLADARALQRRVDIDVQKSVAAASSLRMFSDADRQELQDICNNLTANPSNADAQRRLASWLARHKGQQASVIAQFCLAKPYRDLQAAVGGRVRALETGAASGVQNESSRYQALSNMMKTIGDTAQSMISNMK